MWICECEYIPDMSYTDEVHFCEVCRMVEGLVWIDECELEDCIYAIEVSALCDKCKQKVRVAFGNTE